MAWIHLMSRLKVPFDPLHELVLALRHLLILTCKAEIPAPECPDFLHLSHRPVGYNLYRIKILLRYFPRKNPEKPLPEYPGVGAEGLLPV